VNNDEFLRYVRRDRGRYDFFHVVARGVIGDNAHRKLWPRLYGDPQAICAEFVRLYADGSELTLVAAIMLTTSSLRNEGFGIDGEPIDMVQTVFALISARQRPSSDAAGRIRLGLLG
jgi:hypothetical protein